MNSAKSVFLGDICFILNQELKCSEKYYAPSEQLAIETLFIKFVDLNFPTKLM